jgi:hypothetical protein
MQILLLSTRSATVDGAGAYLRALHATTRSTADLECPERVWSTADAAILFADDFPLPIALAAASRLATPVLVVVTAMPSTFAPLLLPTGARRIVRVLQRPAWGWMLADAIGLAPSPDLGS